MSINLQALSAQLLVGLINGSFYALLSLGLAVIFGMLNIINFAHGALYMMGAFVAYFLLNLAGIGYWPALFLAPIIVGVFGMILERTMLQWIANLDHLYGLLLTFGLALIIQGVFQNYFGSSGLPYAIPDALKGGVNLGFMFLPIYRGWVVVFSLVICIATWFLIERTRLGAYLRAATENPTLVRAFGINVPLMITIQPNGRKLHPAYLFEVKKPEESKGPWDYYKVVATIPADQAFTPLDKSSCPLLKK